MEQLIKELIRHTLNWECIDWHKFRSEFYEEYFIERDSIIIEANANPNNKSLKDKLETSFKNKKLENIKKYNLKYKIK